MEAAPARQLGFADDLSGRIDHATLLHSNQTSIAA
jgi:hypothetical protein